MNWSHFFTSAVGKKVVMGLTGIFLITFLIVHVGLNATIFNDLPIFNPDDNGSMFNRAAHFMGHTLVIRIVEIGLFAGFILHIVQGYMIEIKNRSRRGRGYKVGMGNRSSIWASRNMAIMGTLVFLYLILHVANFWVPARITGSLQTVMHQGAPREVKNLFLRMFEVFQSGWIVIAYVIGVLALGFHLWHGFHSAFRSLGVHNRKYAVMLERIGYGYTIIVCFLFIMMPIAMYFHWVTPYN